MTAIGTLADESKKHNVTGKQLEVGDKLSSISPIPFLLPVAEQIIASSSGLSLWNEWVLVGLNLPLNWTLRKTNPFQHIARITVR